MRNGSNLIKLHCTAFICCENFYKENYGSLLITKFWVRASGNFVFICEIKTGKWIHFYFFFLIFWYVLLSKLRSCSTKTIWKKSIEENTKKSTSNNFMLLSALWNMKMNNGNPWQIFGKEGPERGQKMFWCSKVF